MTLEPKLVGVEAWMKEWTRKQTVIMSFLRLFSRFHITMSINHFEEPCFLDSSPPPTAFPSSDLRIWTKCPTFISADKHFSFWNYWAPAGRRSCELWDGITVSWLGPLPFGDLGFSLWLSPCYCCSVAQPCPTLCHPMDCSTLGLLVPHHLLKFAQVHVHCFGNAIQPSHPLMPSSPSVRSLSQHQGLFLHLVQSMFI